MSTADPAAGAASGVAADPATAAFYARPVLEVAHDLLGATVSHGGLVGRIVEVEAYHESEPACHAHVGLTARTSTLFGPPGHAYVYRSYGIHALLNFVAEDEGTGAAVLVRALEPIEGVETMRARRGRRELRELCSGPGKLTQALGVELELNGMALDGEPLGVRTRPPEERPPVAVAAPRVGITKAADLPWRLCDATSDCVSRPWPAAMRSPFP